MGILVDASAYRVPQSVSSVGVWDWGRGTQWIRKLDTPSFENVGINSTFYLYINELEVKNPKKCANTENGFPNIGNCLDIKNRD